MLSIVSKATRRYARVKVSFGLFTHIATKQSRLYGILLATKQQPLLRPTGRNCWRSKQIKPHCPISTSTTSKQDYRNETTITHRMDRKHRTIRPFELVDCSKTTSMRACIHWMRSLKLVLTWTFKP